MALTGTKTETFTRTLVDAGPDALSNFYYIQFNGGYLQAVSNALKVRAGDFTPPSFTQSVDKKHFISMDVDQPKPEIQGDKKLSFSFRVDENYAIYKALVKQRKLTTISNIGYVNPNVNDYGKNGFFVQVFAPTNGISSEPTSGNYKKLYEFKNCWIMSINGIQFGYNSSTPIKVNVEIGFQLFDDPDNLLFK